MTKESILSIRDLSIAFKTQSNQYMEAVHNINFDLYKKESLAIVGESGSGKSITALSILGLLPKNVQCTGNVQYNKQNLLTINDKQWLTIRSNEIGMIFQNPSTSLDPLYTIGYQIIETIIQHNKTVSKKAAYDKSLELLKHVGIPNPDFYMTSYPHQLSGGQKQRIMIAIAIANNPSILIADEPTTSLDVTIQAQILNLINSIKEESNLSMVFITHDLAIVAAYADRVIILYAGDIVEIGTVYDIFYKSKMPYTIGLINCIPRVDQLKDLTIIKGVVPNLSVEGIQGCPFKNRCPLATDICYREKPLLQKIDGESNKTTKSDHYAACHMHESINDLNRHLLFKDKS